MSMLDTCILGGEVLLPHGVAGVDLGIKDGAIAGIYAPGTAPEAHETIDASGKTVLPGIVDIHFHVRAPAYPERVTVQSDTRAAAAGGVTTIFEMPISKPCCSTPEELERRRDHFLENADVDFALYAAPGDLTEASRDRMVALGCIAWKIFTIEAPPGRDDEFDGLAFPEEADQMRALELLAPTGLPVVVHAESASLLRHFAAAAEALDPNVKLIAPWRIKEFRDKFPGRNELLDYCDIKKIEVKASKQKPYSSDENCLHISYEAGELEEVANSGQLATGSFQQIGEVVDTDLRVRALPNGDGSFVEIVEIDRGKGIEVAGDVLFGLTGDPGTPTTTLRDLVTLRIDHPETGDYFLPVTATDEAATDDETTDAATGG